MHMLAHFLPAQGLTMGQLSIRRAYGEFRNWSMLSNSSSSSLEVEMTYSLWTLLAIFSLNKHGAVRWCESEKVGACTLTVRGGSSRVLSAQSPHAQLARAVFFCCPQPHDCCGLCHAPFVALAWAQHNVGMHLGSQNEDTSLYCFSIMWQGYITCTKLFSCPSSLQH